MIIPRRNKLGLLKFLILFITILYFTIPVFGIDTNTSKTIISPEIKILLPDTLQIKYVNENSNNQFDLVKYMPWIVAIFITLISVIFNSRIARRGRLSAEKNIQIQLKHSKEIAETQFKATIASKNRQEWIDDLRNTLSELISNSSLMVLEMNSHESINNIEIKKITERLAFCKSKIKMLLNDDKEEQKNLKIKVIELVNECIKDINEFNDSNVEKAIENVVTNARILFGIHWRKIKNIN